MFIAPKLDVISSSVLIEDERTQCERRQERTDLGRTKSRANGVKGERVRTGQFLRIPPCESTALLSVGHQDQFMTKAAANKSLFLITQTQHRKMSDIAEKSIAPSVGSRWMEKVKAFLTKTDNPTKLPIRHLQAAGSILILSISDYVSYEELLHICNLDDTFYSFYKLLELHTWMVLHRLRQEGNDGLVAGMAFVDAMWRDIEPRLKIAGAQMSQKTDGLYYLNNHFNSAVVAYDEVD
uniref:Ubiquinol-cytochrome c reductase complex chaperone CBP3-like protein n=1 Tax=Magallana gigas TaxID=29159 RepID=K1RW82_MAGGI